MTTSWPLNAAWSSASGYSSLTMWFFILESNDALDDLRERTEILNRGSWLKAWRM